MFFVVASAVAASNLLKVDAEGSTIEELEGAVDTLSGD
jgi:hypothetical protein